MKRVFLVSLMVIASLVVFSQGFYTPFNVTSTTQEFGRTVPAGTLVTCGYDLYKTTAAAGRASTLNAMVLAGSARLTNATVTDSMYMHTTGTDVCYANNTWNGTSTFLGNVTVGASKLTVAASSGNTAIAGTLLVTGAGTVQGNFAVDTNKFTVATETGNTVVGGTLGVTGNVAVNTNKFTVTAASGNTVVAGTLGVTGDVAVNTNKFTVAAASGNTVAAGSVTAPYVVATDSTLVKRVKMAAMLAADTAYKRVGLFVIGTKLYFGNGTHYLEVR